MNILLFLLILSIGNKENGFNIFTSEVTCSSNYICWHEIGHVLDAKVATSKIIFWQ